MKQDGIFFIPESRDEVLGILKEAENIYVSIARSPGFARITVAEAHRLIKLSPNVELNVSETSGISPNGRRPIKSIYLEFIPKKGKNDDK